MKHAENSQAGSNGVSRLYRDETSDLSGSVSRHQFWKENNNSTFNICIPDRHLLEFSYSKIPTFTFFSHFAMVNLPLTYLGIFAPILVNLKCRF